MQVSEVYVANLMKVYKTARQEVILALDSVTLEVMSGEVFALLGPSGCGKTTLLEIIAGIQQPTRGVVLIRGERVRGPGFTSVLMSQEESLLPWRSVLDNVGFSLEVRGFPRSQRLEVARHYLGLVNLNDVEHRYPHELSGGMKQRVSLARALVAGAPVFLMDEPFGALDSITKMALQDELVRLWGKANRTVIMVSHDIQEVVHLADRVAILSDSPGRVLEVLEIPLQRPRLRFSEETREIEACILSMLARSRGN